MKFYDRKNEIAELERLFEQSEQSAKMTVLTGRRRVGKTILSLEFTKNKKVLYLFVSKKSETLLCLEYVDEIKKVFDYPIIGNLTSFKDIFALLIEISKRERFTLIIDEFQEFYSINASVFSDVQKMWDLNKNNSKMNLIVVGSIYSLMYEIFENSKEPLFGRADRIMFLKPFEISTMNEILKDNDILDNSTLFDFFLLTGGMPKYIDILITNGVKDFDSILDFVMQPNSPFLHEGKHLLIEEFGKEYAIYFSILELISVGKTSRSEIESILEKNVGGYLDRLEKNYAVISKYKPFNAKPASRQQKYMIVDNFLKFWFRFIYKNRSAVETSNFQYLKEICKRDYTTYSGRILESFYHALFAESGKYNRIGSYWETGNKNEIDLVSVNDMKKEIVIAEIKHNKEKIRIEALKNKAKKLLIDFPNYKVSYLGLGIEDVKDYL